MSLDVLNTFSYPGATMGDLDDAPMQDTMTSIDDVDMANEIEYDDSYMDDEAIYGEEPAQTQQVQELEMVVADHEYAHAPELVDEHIIDAAHEAHDISFESASLDAAAESYPVPIVEVEPSLEQLYGETPHFETQSLVEDTLHNIDVHDLPQQPENATFVDPISSEVPANAELRQPSPVPVVVVVADINEPEEPEETQVQPEVHDPTRDGHTQTDTELYREPSQAHFTAAPQDRQTEATPLPDTLAPTETVEQEDDLHIDTPPAVLLSIAGSAVSYSLFAAPTTSEIASTSSASPLDPTLILADRPTLYYEPISAVFDAIRQQPAFKGHCDNAELVFNFHLLNLKLAEDSKWASEFTLHRLWLVNMGCEQGILSMQLECITPRFIDRVRMIEAEIVKRDSATVAEPGPVAEYDQEAELVTVPAGGETIPSVDEYASYEEEVEAAAALDQQALPPDQTEANARRGDEAKDVTEHAEDPEAGAPINYEDDEDGNDDEEANAEDLAAVQPHIIEHADSTANTKTDLVTAPSATPVEDTTTVDTGLADDAKPVEDADDQNNAAAAASEDDLDDPETWQEDTSTLDDSEAPASQEGHTLQVVSKAQDEEDELTNDDAEDGNEFDDAEPAATNENVGSPTDPTEQPDLYSEAQDADSGESDESGGAAASAHEITTAISATSKSSSPVSASEKRDVAEEEEEDDLYNDDAGEESTSAEEDGAEELIDYEDDGDEPIPNKLQAQGSTASNVSSSSSIKRTFREFEDGLDASDDEVPTLESKRSRTKY